MSEDLFGKYEIIRRLNTGGMGEILLARQKGVAGSERTVIIKMMLAHLAADPEFVSRFTDESRLAASLSHGNIVRVFESGCWEGRMYMVMEHVDGLDLREILRSIPADSPISRWIPFHVHVLSETARALTYAYNKKDDLGRPLFIVHRDVSPSNILVSREGLVKLTDFGVAKATRRTSVTMPGRLHGKVSYMAPEQVRGMECDHRSDVFSLGVVGYEMLAGRRPFDGDSDVAVLEKIRSMNLAPLAQAAPDLDPDLSAIVMKALSSNPDDRWQTAEDFSTALLGWAHDNNVNLTSANIAGLLAGRFDTGPSSPASPNSLDMLVDNELDRMIKTPERDRTGTVSRPVLAAPSETPPREGVRKAPVRVWLTVAGAALVLAAITLLVSRLLSVPGPAANPADAGKAVAKAASNLSSEITPAPMPAANSATPVNPGLPPKGPEPADPSRVVADATGKAPAFSGTVVESPGTDPSEAKKLQAVRPRAATQPPDATLTGRLRFRFFPADSQVLIDGRRIAVHGNLVEMDVPPGEHLLTIRSNKGELVESRSFTIEPGEPLALGTIELGETPAP